MPQFIDLTGQKFGRLLVISRADDKITAGGKPRTVWNCLCDCGGTTVSAGLSLRRGRAKSCGCLHKEFLAENKIRKTHGMSNSKEYRIYQGIIKRCCNVNCRNFANYGGRGISVCKRWVESFENFYADMGPMPSANHSIERLNNDGNYEPENCVWATKLQQASNTRSNLRITFDGLTLSAAEWARKYNMHPRTVSQRISRGWSVIDSITKPLRGK